MKILVINPNTTPSMTENIAKVARAVAREGTQIIAVNPTEGPASIQGFYDIAMCIPAILQKIDEYSQIDAIVIACFDDTGLDAIRCLTTVPVIGIGEAAFHAASMLGTKFTVITTLSRSVPNLEANLVRYGLASKCGKVRATEIPVLKLEDNDPVELQKIEKVIEIAINEDGSDTIVLGCAGMADLVDKLSTKFCLPVIDGVTCAITFAEALVAAGLRTSKKGGYATPVSH